MVLTHPTVTVGQEEEEEEATGARTVALEAGAVVGQEDEALEAAEEKGDLTGGAAADPEEDQED